MSFTYRENQNTPLTWAQLDGNFREVESVQRDVLNQVEVAKVAAESATSASSASQSSAELAEEMARISVVRWCGNSTIPPTTRLDGSPLEISDEYGNLTDHLRYNWNGSAWIALNSSAQQLEERLKSSVSGDGAEMVAAERKQPVLAIPATVDFYIATQKLSPWEYAKFITNKPDPNNPKTWDWLPALDNAIAANPNSEIILTGDCAVSATVKVYERATFDCSDGEIIALPGFAQGSPVVRFGDSVNSAAWQGSGGFLRVNAAGQRVIGVEFARAIKAHYGSVRVLKSALIGVKATSGYGLGLPKIDVNAPMINSGDPSNSNADSIGLLVACSDSNFGSGDLTGFSIGAKFTGSNNTIGGLHPWGVYRKDGIPQSAPMLIGLLNEGEGNTFVGVRSDSPSLIDYEQPASLTNGGYGVFNRGNGFRSTFVGCTTFIPNRAAAGEAPPVGKVIAFRTSQSATYVGCEIIDDAGGVLVAGEEGRFSGTAIDTSTIVGRSRYRIGGASQPWFAIKPYFAAGLEFNATYQGPNLNQSSFGACAFDMSDLKYLKVLTNFGGTVRTIYLQRYEKGDSSIASYLSTILDNGNDSGYTLWRTDLAPKRMTVWSGTQFTKPDGTLPI